MAIDRKYLRDERRVVRIAAIAGVLAGVIGFLFIGGIGHRSDPVSPEAVWDFIKDQVKPTGLDPQFVYAIAWAESSLDARARSSVARGIMQLTKPAWREVTDESYRLAWDWKTNIRVGIQYLEFSRDFLKRHDGFSYPLLAAAYRYGPYYVRDKGFDIEKMRKPKNKIYRMIFSGTVRPVVPPQ